MADQQLIELLDTFAEQVRTRQFVLPLAQRQVLQILAHNKAANLSQLAKIRQVRKSSMSVMMSQLIKQQLVVMGYSKSDKRHRLYLLSRLGKETLEADLARYQRWLDQLLEPFTANEKHTFIKVLQSINGIHND